MNMLYVLCTFSDSSDTYVMKPFNQWCLSDCSVRWFVHSNSSFPAATMEIFESRNESDLLGLILFLLFHWQTFWGHCCCTHVRTNKGNSNLMNSILHVDSQNDFWKKHFGFCHSLKRTSDNDPRFGDATTRDVLCIKLLPPRIPQMQSNLYVLKLENGEKTSLTSYLATFLEFEWFSFMLVFRSQKWHVERPPIVKQSRRMWFKSCTKVDTLGC